MLPPSGDIPRLSISDKARHLDDNPAVQAFGEFCFDKGPVLTVGDEALKAVAFDPGFGKVVQYALGAATPKIKIVAGVSNPVGMTDDRKSQVRTFVHIDGLRVQHGFGLLIERILVEAECDSYDLSGAFVEECNRGAL